MTLAVRTAILRGNAVFLLLASVAAFCADVAASFFGAGPEAALLGSQPFLAIGAMEAHGLAFILGLLLWRAAPEQAWHLTAAGIHILLGTCNLLFWEIFVVGNMLAVGYVTTALHGLFVVLQLSAAGSLRKQTVSA
jgi:hypothetical protein